MTTDAKDRTSARRCRCGRLDEFSLEACRVCRKKVCSRCRRTGGCHVKRHSHGNYGQGYSGGRTSRLY